MLAVHHKHLAELLNTTASPKLLVSDAFLLQPRLHVEGDLPDIKSVEQARRAGSLEAAARNLIGAIQAVSSRRQIPQNKG